MPTLCKANGEMETLRERYQREADAAKRHRDETTCRQAYDNRYHKIRAAVGYDEFRAIWFKALESHEVYEAELQRLAGIGRLIDGLGITQPPPDAVAMQIAIGSGLGRPAAEALVTRVMQHLSHVSAQGEDEALPSLAHDDRAVFPASVVRKMWELKEHYRRLAAQPAASAEPRRIGKIVLDEHRHPRAVLETGYDGHGNQWTEGTPIYAAPIAAQAKPTAFDFAAHLQRQRDFSLRTFGPGIRTQGVCDHIRKELREVEAKPDDLSERIDVIILGLDGALRTGASPAQIIDALVTKQAKNEARSWPDWRTMDPDKAIEHDRTADARAAKGADHG